MIKLETIKNTGYQKAIIKDGKAARFERNNGLDSLSIFLELSEGNYRNTPSTQMYANMSYKIDEFGIPKRTPYDAI